MLTGLARRPYDVIRTSIDASHDGTLAGDATVGARAARLRFTLAGEGRHPPCLVPDVGSFDRRP